MKISWVLGTAAVVTSALTDPVDARLRELHWNKPRKASNKMSSPQGKASIAAAPGQVSCAGVIITEFMFDPTEEQGSDSKGEWVEVLNNGCEEQDLSGWQIGDAYKRASMYAADGEKMTLQPGEYAVIIGKNSLVEERYLIPEDTRIFLSRNAVIGNKLNDNDGDEVFLLDADSNVVDKVSYEVGAACTGGSTSSGTGASKGGMSMERRDPLGPGDCSNFSPSSTVGGSPGSKNPDWVGDDIDVPCVCTTEVPTRPCQSIIITEVLYDPAGSDSGREFVEILNNGVENVDLSGWHLSDLRGSNALAANGGSMVLSPGEYAVLVERDRPDDAVAFLPGTRTFAAGKQLGNGLGNTGDTLFIKDAEGFVVDKVVYADKAVPGKSLERIDTGPGVITNFQESEEVGGTPGRGTAGIENAEPACKSECKPKNLDICIAIDRSGKSDNHHFFFCRYVF